MSSRRAAEVSCINGAWGMAVVARARRAPTGARGMALIAVLWVIALLTLLASTVVTLSVTHRRTAQRYAEAVQADLTADSAIRIVLLRLISPAGRESGFQVGQTQSISLFGSSVEVRIERESGRVDLNTADPALLFALFAANGWKENDARFMVARITAWKDADDVTEEGGAEARQYREANLSYGPRNAPFETVDELRQVLGSERIGDELFNSLTVFTHSTGSLESAATPAVKRALIWADERELGGHHWLAETASGRGAGSTMAPDSMLSGEVVRLHACMSLREGRASRCRMAVVRLTGSVVTPLQVFEWKAAR